MTDLAARKSLLKRLGDFLGFHDDSLSDVLDHLLSIESEVDLLDYLSQLLGSKDDDIREYVKDVDRFRKGLPLEGIVEEGLPIAATKPPANPQPPAPAAKKEPPAKPANQAKAASKPATTNNAPTKASPAKDDTSANKAATENNNVAKVAVAAAPPSKESKETTKTAAAAAVIEKPPPKKYGLPPKGKAKRNCGCFGTLHKPLTNCLYCGRISCSEEGYDYCNFCGYLVELVKPPKGEAQAKAWQHKERLLRYDRDSAKRTIVLDDQADYYSNQTSTWLSEEERYEAEDQDAENRSNIHQRQKQTLNIAF